ncbi:MAG: GAF domain-containing sensor histidine kinase [Aquabacterium sp.]
MTKASSAEPLAARPGVNDAPAAVAESPQATPTASWLRRWWDRRGLPVQVLLCGAGMTLVLAWLAHGPFAEVLAGGLAGSLPALPLLVAGALVAGAASWPAWRAARALDAIGEAARTLRRDDAPDDLDLPLQIACAELQRSSARLRRMVQAMRERRLALLARNAELGQQLHQRTHELSTLQDLSLNLASKRDLHELVDEALRALEQTVDYGSASLWAREALQPAAPVLLMGYRSGETGDDATLGGLVGQRLSRANLLRYEQFEREREPVVDNDARQSLLSWLWELVTDDARTSALYRGSRSWMGVPLKFHDAVLGVLRVDHDRPGYFTPERARLLNAVCSQAALAMRHAQMLSASREVAVLAERNRIARDLHDAVSQTLFAAQMVAGTLVRIGQRDGADWARQAVLLERLSRGALAEMRLLMYELKPDALEQTPLAELLQLAVEALQCRGDLQLQASLAPADDLPVLVRQHLYRMAQEALSNIARHSRARQASVLWQVDRTAARLRIADDGVGFDPARPRPGHFGLGNLATRAREIGAQLTIRSAPGEGTDILVEWTRDEPRT